MFLLRGINNVFIRFDLLRNDPKVYCGLMIVYHLICFDDSRPKLTLSYFYDAWYSVRLKWCDKSVSCPLHTPLPTDRRSRFMAKHQTRNLDEALLIDAQIERYITVAYAMRWQPQELTVLNNGKELQLHLAWISCRLVEFLCWVWPKTSLLVFRAVCYGKFLERRVACLKRNNNSSKN